MKSKEELNALKEKIETVNKKLRELTEEELAQVTGGKYIDDYSDSYPVSADIEYNDPNPRTQPH